ncbi:TPA: hypothetical protein U2J52_002999 [Providencia rettgeri]|uniref:hypothetical protein n=1 Tax=Providencia sp. PROV255 TaxID=2949943 RepID=UPI00234ACA17|nr:hypothetical protein [Providencia sp. PROV255]HEM7526764.1 hypothetical protein [Providencia rettgeri]
MILPKKISLLFKSFYLSFYYFITCLFSNRKNDDHDYEIIVSLTTFPARIKTIFLTIESILAQKTNVKYKVILYLSENEFENKKIPWLLKKQKNRGLNIEFVKDNIKSYKKLHYTLKNHPSHPILTADDDIIYPNDWINNFYIEHKEHPNNILYARGHRVLLNENGEPIDYTLFSPPIPYKPLMLVIPTGVSGILYPPRSLHHDVLNSALFLSLAPNADDIWYRIMSLLNDTSCILIYKKSIHFTPILGTQFKSLRKVNISNQGINNNKQLLNLINYYNIDLTKFLDRDNS